MLENDILLSFLFNYNANIRIMYVEEHVNIEANDKNIYKKKVWNTITKYLLIYEMSDRCLDANIAVFHRLTEGIAQNDGSPLSVRLHLRQGSCYICYISTHK